MLLLNGVLKCSRKFPDKAGKKLKKATIKDAEQSLILHLTSISNIKIKINQLIENSYANKSTLQPFIIVEGSDITVINSFFVYYDDIFYKFDSFIDALDCAFKIFHVFNFSYPQISALSWTFIQNYFYEIHSKLDLKSASLSSLLNYMLE